MSEYLEFAKEIALEAGNTMRRYFENEENTVETKVDNTPVTIADTNINRMVIEEVSRTFAEHGVVGEEESYQIESQYLWVCDPIDGTRPFTYGMPFSTFNLALTHNGKSIVAVQYDPYQNRLYSAEKGQGAWLNNEPIKMTGEFEGRVPINIEIYRGGSSILHATEAETEAIKALTTEKWYFMKLGSVGYSLGRVACGKFGAAVFSGGSPYEAATGNLLITEAGGRFTNLFGEKIERYDGALEGFIAAHPAIHQEIINSLAPFIAKYKTRP
jgi:myo-inositol-1(or 4)-monophosphatase